MRQRVFAALITAVFACEAWATLGGKEDQLAPVSRTNLPSYHRLETKSGTADVSQFAATANGKVFALSWIGRIDDRLPELLGDYGADFAAYNKLHPHRSGRIPYRKVAAGRVIVEFWDMPKMVRGRAYVPALMPNGVTTDDIH